MVLNLHAESIAAWSIPSMRFGIDLQVVTGLGSANDVGADFHDFHGS